MRSWRLSSWYAPCTELSKCARGGPPSIGRFFLKGTTNDCCNSGAGSKSSYKHHNWRLLPLLHMPSDTGTMLYHVLYPYAYVWGLLFLLGDPTRRYGEGLLLTGVSGVMFNTFQSPNCAIQAIHCKKATGQHRCHMWANFLHHSYESLLCTRCIQCPNAMLVIFKVGRGDRKRYITNAGGRYWRWWCCLN